MPSETMGPEHSGCTATLSERRNFTVETSSALTKGPLSAPAVAGLRSAVDGQVVLPDEPAYKDAHLVWNRDLQQRPAVVVECANADDVSAAVLFARAQQLPLAVRGGGFCPAGTSTCDGGVVIDMRAMRGVSVDRPGATAVVGAGATWGDVDPATQRHGLVVPGLPVSGIGVAGSTIGGGYGHLRRAYGLACDNLLSADLVTADGTKLTASGDMNPELLWGLRGGGGNFGVLTALTFRLRPLPEPVMCGALLFSAERVGELLAFYRSYTARLREDVTTRFSLIGASHSPLVSQTAGRTAPVVAISVACVGHPIEAEDLVRPLRAAAPAMVDLLAVRPYIDLQAGANAAYPPGAPAAVDSAFLGALDDDAIDALCDQFAGMPPGSCEIHLDHMGGAVGRVAQMSTAAPNRGAPYLVSAMARWSDASDEAAHREWLAATRTRLQPSTAGGPHIGLTSSAVPSEQAYGVDRYLRLAALKGRFDPDNVFARNQNIMPIA